MQVGIIYIFEIQFYRPTFVYFQISLYFHNSKTNSCENRTTDDVLGFRTQGFRMKGAVGTAT